MPLPVSDGDFRHRQKHPSNTPIQTLPSVISPPTNFVKASPKELRQQLLRNGERWTCVMHKIQGYIYRLFHLHEWLCCGLFILNIPSPSSANTRLQSAQTMLSHRFQNLWEKELTNLRRMSSCQRPHDMFSKPGDAD